MTRALSLTSLADMPDPDLDRIIADLQRRRAELDRLIREQQRLEEKKNEAPADKTGSEG